MSTPEELQSEISARRPIIERILSEVRKMIVGQEMMVERLLIGLLADGHVLMEGLPGLAKTTAVKALAKTLQASFQRIQFTPDLLPADIVGTQIYQPKTGEFTIKQGPIFHNIILADEINRAPAKVQSALLEAMQERQVTIANTTFQLDPPFLVLATQNPIEQEGTYPLPEAQVDRFMLKVKISYPTLEEEKEIVKRMSGHVPDPVSAVVTPQQVIALRKLVDQVYVDDKVADYVVRVVFATRDPKRFNLAVAPFIQFGASPRASLSLTAAARAYALLRGRAYVTPFDVKSIGLDVLRHRIILSYEAEAEGLTTDDVVLKIFDSLEVP
ncbi:MAG: MoxR family ATPase [bacterium]